MTGRIFTHALDRVAWEIYCRLPWEWEAFGRKGLRARFARACGNRVRIAVSARRFIP
jgi:hypothetical protein